MDDEGVSGTDGLEAAKRKRILAKRTSVSFAEDSDGAKRQMSSRVAKAQSAAVSVGERHDWPFACVSGCSRRMAVSATAAFVSCPAP